MPYSGKRCVDWHEASHPVRVFGGEGVTDHVADVWGMKSARGTPSTSITTATSRLCILAVAPGAWSTFQVPVPRLCHGIQVRN
jgi:hypothetical protein